MTCRLCSDFSARLQKNLIFVFKNVQPGLSTWVVNQPFFSSGNQPQKAGECRAAKRSHAYTLHLRLWLFFGRRKSSYTGSGRAQIQNCQLLRDPWSWWLWRPFVNHKRGALCCPFLRSRPWSCLHIAVCSVIIALPDTGHYAPWQHSIDAVEQPLLWWSFRKKCTRSRLNSILFSYLSCPLHPTCICSIQCSWNERICVTCDPLCRRFCEWI